MAIEGQIECVKCGRAVVPQLWVDTRNRLEHPTVRHLCPICGTTLRASGGGINRGMLALIIGSISLLALILVFTLVMSRS